MKDEKETSIPEFTKKEGDTIEYLEKRFSLTKRKTKVHLVNELNYLYNKDKLEKISDVNTSQSSKKNEESDLSDYSENENENQNEKPKNVETEKEEKTLTEKKNQ